MSTLSTPAAADATADLAEEVGTASIGWWPTLVELTKARLSALVVFTTASGFVVASQVFGIDWLTLLWTVLGTSLAACSAATLNQVIEVERDRRMKRTASRPIPSGRTTRGQAYLIGMVMGFVGIMVLATLVNLAAAGLALLTIILYVAVYTPMKPVSTLNTIVGAVVGALPPMIGWVAVRGTLPEGAWLLGALLFVWQIPHFFALAWMYRDEYEAAGFKMLPVLDRDGHLTAQVTLMTSLLLIPIALVCVRLGLAGWIFLFGGVVGAGWMTYLSWQLYKHRTRDAARRVFLSSIIYLPVVLILMMLDAGPISGQVNL